MSRARSANPLDSCHGRPPDCQDLKAIGLEASLLAMKWMPSIPSTLSKQTPVRAAALSLPCPSAPGAETAHVLSHPPSANWVMRPRAGCRWATGTARCAARNDCSATCRE